jgi:hypothetical protein
MALDLREFATRDKVEAHNSNPNIPPKEANHTVVNQANFACKTFEKVNLKN